MAPCGLIASALVLILFSAPIAQGAECEFLGFPGGDAVITMQNSDSCTIGAVPAMGGR